MQGRRDAMRLFRAACALICGAVLLMAGCASKPKPPSAPLFRVVWVLVERDILVTTKLRIRLEVENPGDLPMELRSMRYEFFGEDMAWTEGESAETLVVPALGRAQTSLCCTMSFANTDRRLLDLVATLRRLRYRLRGRAVIGIPAKSRQSVEISFDESGICAVER